MSKLFSRGFIYYQQYQGFGFTAQTSALTNGLIGAVQWINGAAFALPAKGSFGSEMIIAYSKGVIPG